MKVIHHVVDIDATADAVWIALTDGSALARWWTTEVEAEPAGMGATVRFTFAGPFNPVMEVTTFRPGEELAWRCTGGVDQWRNNDFRFTFAAVDGMTRLRFWQDYATELSDDDYGSYNFNWGYYLESLRLYCTSGEGKPFKPEH